uniref:DNA polymerase epsilon subunit 4 n=2 Tax=Monodelphis domestica TaxID=13616 RepID=F6WZI7_MONDO
MAPEGRSQESRAGKGPAPRARVQAGGTRPWYARVLGMAAAAATAAVTVSSAATPVEEEGPSGEAESAAAPQPQAPAASIGPRLSRLPLARVKALVKADPDVTLAGQEAIFILARAAELFVETIARDAYFCAQQGKRKTLQRKDLDNAIEAVDEFAFLEGTLD